MNIIKHPFGFCSGGIRSLMPYIYTVSYISELEIMVGYRIFSLHIAQMSEHSSLCAGRHSLLEQYM